MRRRRDRRLEQIEALYERRFGYFVRVAQAIVGERERAKETVQDAFADAIRSRETFRGEGALEAWVWRLVVNAARKTARRRPILAGHDEPAEDELPAWFGDVAPFVASLPERQRVVVFLRYYADLDYRSIADAVGIEVGTVGATLASAHVALRRALEEVRADA